MPVRQPHSGVANSEDGHQNPTVAGRTDRTRRCTWSLAGRSIRRAEWARLTWGAGISAEACVLHLQFCDSSRCRLDERRKALINIVVLFFLLGLFAGLTRSELKLPGALYDSLSLILLLAIGLKGGEGLAKQALAPLLPDWARSSCWASRRPWSRTGCFSRSGVSRGSTRLLWPRTTVRSASRPLPWASTG